MEYDLEDFNFEKFGDCILKLKQERDDGKIYLGSLVDFDKRFITEWPQFFIEVVGIMKEASLIENFGIIEDFGGRKRFHLINFS